MSVAASGSVPPFLLPFFPPIGNPREPRVSRPLRAPLGDFPGLPLLFLETMAISFNRRVQLGMDLFYVFIPFFVLFLVLRFSRTCPTLHFGFLFQLWTLPFPST